MVSFEKIRWRRTHPGLTLEGMTRSTRHALGFWVVAATFFAATSFATLPTPLYAIYQERAGFPSIVVTVVFSTFAVGVMLSLYLVGHLSDTWGRRPLLVVGALAEVASVAVFLATTALPGLLVARLLCGIGVGVLAATATAALAELHAVARPGRGPRTPSTVAGVANLGGLAAGPLVGGVLANVVGRPLHTPYVLHGVVLVVVAVALLLVPETVARPAQRPPYHPQRVAVPPHHRGTFWRLALTGSIAFSVLGTFASLAPAFLGQVLDVHDHAVVGGLVAVVFGSATVAQVAAATWAPDRLLRVGALSMSLGLLLVGGAAVATSLPLIVTGGAFAGAGVGLAFRAAVGGVGTLAPPAQRGEALAGVFLVAYAGLTVPVVLVGLALTVAPAPATLLGFALVVAVAAPLAARAARRAVAAPLRETGDARDGDRGRDLEQVTRTPQA